MEPKIVHFDIDEQIDPLLEGDKRGIPLKPETIGDIPDAAEIEIATVKSHSRVSAEVVESMPALKLLITRTVGTDHIDREALKRKGIITRNIPDYGSHNIAELAVCLLLIGARRIMHGYCDVQSGSFDYRNCYGMSVMDKTVGVIGTGKIGQDFIKRIHAFGVQIIANDPRPDDELIHRYGVRFVDPDTLYAQSDFISVHAPLVEGTRHMIDDTAIAKMKDGVVLINTARGEIISTDALVRNIGKFRALCLDVIENESGFNTSHPLLKHDKVLITPHIGFFTDMALKSIASQTIAIIEEYTAGNLSE